MTWTRISDTWTDDERVLACGRSARWLDLEAKVWANRQGTDGRIPTAVLRRISDAENINQDAAELVAAGLWKPIENGYLVEWGEQEAAADVRQRREVSSERQKRYRRRSALHAAGDHSLCDARWCPDVTVTRHVTRHVTDDVTRHVTDDVTVTPLRNATHTLPIPTPPFPAQPYPSQTQTHARDDHPAEAADARTDSVQAGPARAVGFDAVADVWPKKEGLRQARAEWRKALEREGGRLTPAELTRLGIAYAEAMTANVEPGFHKRLDRWLDDGAYNDDPPRPARGGPARVTSNTERLIAGMHIIDQKGQL